MSPLERRRVATDKVLKRFRGKPFDWGKANCVHLAAAQLRAMGHALPKVPKFSTAIGAKKALAARGWESVSAMLDDVLPDARIAPAMMLLGDLAVLEGEEDAQGLDAIVVCAGPLKFFGWSEGAEGLVILDIALDKIAGAWRV